MIITVIILLFLLVPSLYVNFVFSKKLLQFDDLFDLLSHDVNTQSAFIKDKVIGSGIVTESKEVVEAYKQLKIMGQRMEEFSTQMRTRQGKVNLKDRNEEIKNKPQSG